MNVNRPLLHLFLIWLTFDLVCLAIGIRWSWFLDIGLWGLPPDFLLGVMVLGQYLRENGKL